MNIIQSFYQIDRKVCYQYGNGSDNYLINYYSMLLSYITLKKLYGSVRVYCNDFAYDKIIKYIPYDDIIVDEVSHISLDNYNAEWGMLKFHVFEKQTEPFIHIDSDVFMFNDLLSEYWNNDEYEAIVQSIDLSDELYGVFYRNNFDKLMEYGLIDNEKTLESIEKYNECVGYNNGVIGIKNMDFLKLYIERAKKYNELMNQEKFIEVNHQTIIFEQFNIFHTALQNSINVHEVLPYDQIKQYGFNKVGNNLGYTHLLSGNKYVGHFIMLVRNKIMKIYPEYIKYLEEFEKTIVDANIRYLKHMDLHKYVNKI